MRIHGALDNEYVIQFIDAVVVENNRRVQKFIPAVYMLLEFAGGGDLFDKIGGSFNAILNANMILKSTPVPDVGVDSDIAQHYFTQLVSGVV
jgi:serine/threonine-protein kinase CHEK1